MLVVGHSELIDVVVDIDELDHVSGEGVVGFKG